jgi:hypothetical protein
MGEKTKIFPASEHRSKLRESACKIPHRAIADGDPGILSEFLPLVWD